MITITLDDIKSDFEHAGMIYVACEKTELVALIKKHQATKQELEAYRRDIAILREGATKMLHTLNLVDHDTGEVKELGVSDIIKIGTSLIGTSKEKLKEKFSFISTLMPILHKYGTGK